MLENHIKYILSKGDFLKEKIGITRRSARKAFFRLIARKKAKLLFLDSIRTALHDSLLEKNASYAGYYCSPSVFLSPLTLRPPILKGHLLLIGCLSGGWGSQHLSLTSHRLQSRKKLSELEPLVLSEAWVYGLQGLLVHSVTSLFETLAIVTVRHMYMTEFKGKHKTDYTQFFFFYKKLIIISNNKPVNKLCSK